MLEEFHLQPPRQLQLSGTRSFRDFTGDVPSVLEAVELLS
jgi:hypothetical protein